VAGVAHQSLLNLVDISALSAIAHQHGAVVAVDSTFATPYLQNPIDLGADIVVHSATKYLGGHSDVLLGLVAVSDDKLFADIKFIQNSAGGVPGPQDCFLTLRGIKTLHLRMERHCDNAEQVAAFLRKHPKVEKVFFPGFADHPGHAIAKQQMRRFGGIVTIWLKRTPRRSQPRGQQAAAVCPGRIAGRGGVAGQPQLHHVARRHAARAESRAGHP
jgi:cystathionine gamma-lyase/cystathionine beta-lyase